MEQVFQQVEVKSPNTPLRIAVLGCGDIRIVDPYRKIFAGLLNRQVSINIFDITIEHLKGESNVYEFDATQPVPEGPYDIAYANELLKFIETERQWYAIENSYGALNDNGVAIHILDNQDFDESIPAAEGFYKVPLEMWKRNMYMQGIQFYEIPLFTGPKRKVEEALALVLVK